MSHDMRFLLKFLVIGLFNLKLTSPFEKWVWSLPGCRSGKEHCMRGGKGVMDIATYFFLPYSFPITEAQFTPPFYFPLSLLLRRFFYGLHLFLVSPKSDLLLYWWSLPGAVFGRAKYAEE